MSRDNKYIICPYHKDETGNSLRCEGVFSAGCINTFRNSGEKNAHINQYCATFNYSRCTLARMLEKKHYGVDY